MRSWLQAAYDLAAHLLDVLGIHRRHLEHAHPRQQDERVSTKKVGPLQKTMIMSDDFAATYTTKSTMAYMCESFNPEQTELADTTLQTILFERSLSVSAAGNGAAV